jgi:DGQHR domain-containing protein
LAKSKSAKAKKKPLTPEEKKKRARQRAFARQHRMIFERAGFKRIVGVDGKHFTFDGVKSELDDLYVFENVVVMLEYTISSGPTLATHVKGKAGSHNKIASKPYEFLEKLAELSTPVKEFLDLFPYSKNQAKFKLIYCSDEEVESHHQAFYNSTKFMPRPVRMYFYKLCYTLRKSARFELFDYLGIDPQAVGENGVFSSGAGSHRYHGSVLPPEHSNFPAGYRIASFYVDPEALLRRAYVLRRGGWKDSLNLYQRMIIPKKVNDIRRHLREQHRVFANNIVLTLPDDTEFRDGDDQIIDTSALSETTPAWVVIKDKPNSIGIVDGQHRVFSYFEDTQPDPLIDKYRKQQNLLATGIVYPSGMSKPRKERFEAGLFLEINSNQASARSDLKQAISLILDPFRPISVARTVVDRLAETAPLAGILEKSAYDVGRLRTTTIVTYGIQPLVKRSGDDSLFSVWNDPEKDKIVSSKNAEVLARYIDFCVDRISAFLAQARSEIGAAKWKIAVKGDSGVLTVTAVNSLVILMRKLIEGGYMPDGTTALSLAPLTTVGFSTFKSSQYAALATAMYDKVT